MLPNDILLLLTRLLGPLKTRTQDDPLTFNTFQDKLRQSLTQPSLEFRKSSVQFPEFQSIMFPDNIRNELEKMTDEIVAAQALRKPADPVFWLRQRNLPVTSAVEESAENIVEPESSFGPFINQHSKSVWFDFFQVPKQIRFQIIGVPDFLVISLPTADSFPTPGQHSSLTFADCTIWISVKTVVQNGDKKYVGIRAKNCEFSGFIAVEADGIIHFFAQTFTLNFQPFDAFATGRENNALPKASYPDKITLSFTGSKWAVQSFANAAVNPAGDAIELTQGANGIPQYLETESLLHVPLIASKNSWEIVHNQTERFRLNGKATLNDAGWYLPVISTDNAVGVGMLGTSVASGYLGFRGTDGLTLDWPGLENGKLTLSKFLLLARPGRINLNYSYEARSRIKQQFTLWKTTSGGDDHSILKLKPLPAGTGNCIDDNQPMEALLQTAQISARADRPLNTNQQRFDLSEFRGAVLFVKTETETSIIVIGAHLPPAAGEPRKRRIPQSLCLRNALLTVDNPITLFVEGHLLTTETVSEGALAMTFRVYRLINTLPDPYISNQDEIFDQTFERFNELWRTGQDTLPDQFLFSATSIVRWTDEGTALEFTMNQSPLISRINDLELFNAFPGIRNPCAVDIAAVGFVAADLQSTDINTLKQLDSANIAGAYGFLQWLPGNRSLVDVSGRANFWGVSFSNTVPEERKLLSESLGFPAQFPFRIKDMDLVSSGRMSRLFTLPHIQWEPVMNITNPLVEDGDIPDIFNFSTNGNPTRIASAGKNEVVLAPRPLYESIIEGFNSTEKLHAVAAHFTLPFGICAFAYFNPKSISGFPSAIASRNEPTFSDKKTGESGGGLQLHVEAIHPPDIVEVAAANQRTYFIGTARQAPIAGRDITILGNKITNPFNSEFSSGINAKVPLQRIDFSGYGASIFSNWLDESANFGQVSQVKFDVMIGRTAHEVVQIKSILFPWGVPVVRSIVMQRKNSGLVTRYDSGWVAQGPGEFDFLSHREADLTESNPYMFHPGLVTGIYNVREIRDLPAAMDIPFTVLGKPNRFTGVYFNGDIQIENITKGTRSDSATNSSTRVHSIGQLGYVLLADPSLIKPTTKLEDLVSPALFKQLLQDPKIGGNLGGPVNAVMNIASSGQRMQVSRVDVSASAEANVSFVVAIRGTIELVKEGSWTVAKCLPSKDVIPISPSETVPVIRHGPLIVKRVGNTVTRTVLFKKLPQLPASLHCLGDPVEIDKYAVDAITAPALQYSFLQTTDTQKLLFRRPAFRINTQKIFTEIPDLADAFRLLDCNSIFPNLAKTLSLPDNVKALTITSEGNGFKFEDAFFEGPINLTNFVPHQLTLFPESQVYTLIDKAGFKVLIRYGTTPNKPASFQVDLNSDAPKDAVDGARKKWQTINKDVAVEVHLGPLKPLLTLKGQFRSEAGKEPVFENPNVQLGPDLEKVKDILQVLATLSGQSDAIANSLKVVMGNSPNSWNYKMSIEQRIPVIQFPSTAEITLTTPPPLIIEASLLLGVFFNLSLSPDPKNLIKPSAGAVFGFEGMIQIQLITIGIAAAYGVGITKVKAYVDLSNPTPDFEFTFGFGATVIVDLPVVGLASVTRSFSLTGNVDSGQFLIVAGQMLRGVLSLAGGLLIVSIQIEGKAGVQRKNSADAADKSTVALFEMIFTLDVSLAFVISYDFSKSFSEEITLS